MQKLYSLCKRRLQPFFCATASILYMTMLTAQPVFAEDAATGGENIWSRFSTIMQDVYGELVAISTIVGVTVASIALIIRMVSRNQRAVDEATGWLKRIVITWIVLNSLGFIAAYLQPLISGGQYTP